MSENFNDVSDAFDGLEQTVVGTRPGAGSYVSGRWVGGASSSLSFQGVVQNANPDDLKVVPEGNRTEESIKIHTKFKLIAQVKNTTKGDEITYRGSIWLVFNVANRFIGNYHKAIAMRQG